MTREKRARVDEVGVERIHLAVDEGPEPRREGRTQELKREKENEGGGEEGRGNELELE